MITDIEDYFAKGCGRCERFDTEDCSTRRWREGLQRLRDICRSSSLTETVKWAHPCYMYAGRNIVIIGALRNDFRLSFFDAALLRDPHRVLERQGPNTQQADMIRLTSNAQVAEMETIIRAYLDEAKGYAAVGRKATNTESVTDLPQELAEVLDADPELAEAFHALTHGRRKSYVINLISAKQSATRAKRITKFREKIIAGKGATER